MGFQKDSELLPLVNYYLSKMRESGLLDKIRQVLIQFHLWITEHFLCSRDKWYPPDDGRSSPSGASSAGEVTLLSLGYSHLTYPFVVLLGGLVLSLLSTLFEAAIVKCKGSTRAEKHHFKNVYST